MLMVILVLVSTKATVSILCSYVNQKYKLSQL